MYHIETGAARRGAMRIEAGLLACAAVVLIGGPLAAAPLAAGAGAHRGARPHYNYALAHPVREGFREAPAGRYCGREDYYAESHYRENSYYRESGPVVESLHGDFTGGVGHGGGGDYFVDGYGQAHFFVGGFRNMTRLPHGPYGPRRFGPGRRF
jgi:hypothetical protein